MLSNEFRLRSYNYQLPKELIAQHPAPKRDHSRMLLLQRQSGKISHHNFDEIVSILPDSSCLVINNTKVLPARILGKRKSGARIEALLVDEKREGLWTAIVRKGGKIKNGEILEFSKGHILAVAQKRLEDGKWLLSFDEGHLLKSRLEKFGLMPLPPYIDRRSVARIQNDKDRERYQTCFAREPGAIAAPTAGLHFTPEIIQKIRDRGIEILEVTLHVGVGTFSSIKVDDIRHHKMHDEYFTVTNQTLLKLKKFQQNKKDIICLGTTSVRVLETLAQKNFQIRSGWTDIFIHSPYKFKMTNGLLTNFHLPKSTLLIMVSAFCGRDFLLSAYKNAIERNYRFFSYGDCMLIL